TDGTSTTILVGERSSDLALSTWTAAIPGSSVPPQTVAGPSGAAPVLVLGHTGTAAAPSPPNGTPTDVAAFRSRHPGGANFLVGDGSVHLVSQGITPGAWIALGTRAGGEVITDSGF